MKVILLQDVARIGKRFEVANVPDGHALNMLIPKRMAEPATPENLKRLEARKSKVEAGKAAAAENFASVVETVNGSTQVLAMDANEQGHFFQAVKPEQVAELISVLPEQVTLPETIKEVGEHEVTITDGEHTATFTLKVEAK